MRIAIGSDHAGLEYKERLKPLLARLGHEVHDFGTHSAESCDYPRFIRPVAEAVAGGQFERGIVLGGSGTAAAASSPCFSSLDQSVCRFGFSSSGSPGLPQRPTGRTGEFRHAAPNGFPGVRHETG